MRADRDRLEDILEAIEQIQSRMPKSRKEFDSDDMTRVWIIRHLEIIGEACRTLSPDFKAVHPEIPWRTIADMRNILIHEYFRIDANQVWVAAAEDVPSLKAQIFQALKDTEHDDAGADL